MAIHDCLVIGAGPAGATAAFHLARLGRRVLLLEKSALPRVKPCGGGVSPQVAQWLPFDLSPAISTKVTRLRFTWELNSPLEADFETGEPLWMVRRDRFDQLLVEQAVAQGAELQAGVPATRVTWDQGHWRVESEGMPFEAHYVIAADGALGRTSKALGFPKLKHLLAGALEAEPLFPMTDLRTAHLDFGTCPNGYAWAFPKAEGWSMGVGAFRGKKAGNLKQSLAVYARSFGLDDANLPVKGHPIRLWDGDQTLHTQQALLAGEAACLADPFTAEGIRPAILSGHLAAQAVHDALSGVDRALESYSHHIQEQWGTEMRWARRLAQIFYRMPSTAYHLAIRHPGAVHRMGQLLVGEIRYSEVAHRAIARLMPGGRS